MKHIIGLDLGTNSIGWTLILEEDTGNISIKNTGVYIFPIGTIVDDKTGKEKTHNEQRREYRGASRMRCRYKKRRKNLKKILERLGMLPDYSIYHKAKGSRQSYEFYKLRAEAINPEIKIPLKEIGRIFILLNKYRGFKSNSKKIKGIFEEEGIVLDGINELKKFMNTNQASTIGEYFFRMHQKAEQLYNNNKWHNPNEPIDERAINKDGEIILFNSNGIRRHFGRYTHRDMYLDEFDKIWEAQMKHYPTEMTGSPLEYKAIKRLPYKERIENLKKFRNTNYWKIREYCIYFQRPLKSQKKYVSNCQFEKNKKTIPVSHPLFQEFRMYKNLADIRYADEENFNSPLKKEWIEKLIETLKIVDHLYIRPNKITKEKNLPTFYSILGINEKEIKLLSDNNEIEKYIYGNRTYASFYEALGTDKFHELKNQGKLELLWHCLYMAKDGLLKEDEWLEGILTDKSKWNFSQEEAKKLIENGLESDYGSYSSKALKKIVVQQSRINDENGNIIDERRALNLAGYLYDENTLSKDVKLNTKIRQLKFQEIRNPVVEKAVSKAIKIVNAILEKYRDEINQEKLEIRIESTRELKKPRSEREKLRRQTTDTDKLRQQYADFLNIKRNELGITKRIEKYDSLINKYELWLQMGMDENDEMFKEEFKGLSKVTKQEDKLKHKLWLECGRICPYTNKTINLTTLFSSEIEIEHIIPLSRSLDNSFNNKTLTFSSINKEKGSRTASEYLKSKGEDEFKRFKKRLEKGIHAFSKAKVAQFLLEKVPLEFTANQMSNTSYISKFAKKKMLEVCRTVNFTNGMATAELRTKDWSLSNLLDKIRYEEDSENNVNMDQVYIQYYSFKKDLINWLTKKKKSADFKINWNNFSNDEDIKDYVVETGNDIIYWWKEIEKFNQFRNKSGKKDRNDHRHHAIDAFVTACCSPKIIKELSTHYAKEENEHLTEREKIERCFNYEELKQSISSILVCHHENQNLIKKRKNKITTKNGFKITYTYAPQGKLHEESYYSKINRATIRRDKLFSDKRQEKPLFADIDDLHYKVKGTIKWNYIHEKELYNAVKGRLETLGKKSFTKEEMENNPFYMTSLKEPDKIISKKGKPLPIIKSVRKRFNIDRTLIHLPAKNEEKEILFDNRYANNETNFIMALYERKSYDRKGNPKKPEREFELLPFIKAVNKKNPHKSDSLKFFTDEKNDIGLSEDCKWIKRGDIVGLYINEDDKKQVFFDEQKNEILKNRLFKVKSISSSIVNANGKAYEYGYINLQKINIAKSDSYPPEKDIVQCIKQKSFKLSHDKFNAIKIRLSPLGEILLKGNECF